MSKINLTDRTITQLVAPTQGRVEVLDARMPGLAIRVAPSGRKTWTVLWHQARQTRRYAFATYPAVSLATAREKARQLLAGLARGEDPVAKREAAAGNLASQPPQDQEARGESPRATQPAGFPSALGRQLPQEEGWT